MAPLASWFMLLLICRDMLGDELQKVCTAAEVGL